MIGLAAVGDGRYTLTERIATGGMGEVWRATDSVLGRDVAVKILKGEYADDPIFRARLEAEARTAAGLHHPGIAQVFDYGEASPDDPGGHTVAYLVMELVPGEPLSAVLAREGALPPERAADLVAQAAEAIDVAHRGGVVHRDVKPANLLVTPDGVVKVTDFGIARAADAVPLTQTGQVIGTPQYFAPEQARGGPATPASDVYSLGVVLYESLAGRRPFEGAPVAVAMSHLREPVPPLPDSVPDAPAAVCMRALVKDPAERTSSAAELAAQLRRPEAAPLSATAAATVAPPTRPLTAATRLQPAGGSGRRRWRLPALAAAAVVVLIGAVAFALSGGDPAGVTQDRSPRQPPASPGPSVQQPGGASDSDGVGTGTAPEEDRGDAPAPDPAAGKDDGSGDEDPEAPGRSEDRGKSGEKGKSEDRGGPTTKGDSGKADDDGED